MRRIAEDLPKAKVQGRVSDVMGALLRMETELIVAHPGDVTPERLQALRGALAGLSTTLTAAYLT